MSKKKSYENNNIEKLKSLIVSSLEDDKAEDIMIIDLQGKTEIADYMIVATGRVDRHIMAMADHIKQKVKEEDIYSEISIEGAVNCQWVLIDAHDIIVHLFKHEARELYNIEEMWQRL